MVLMEKKPLCTDRDGLEPIFLQDFFIGPGYARNLEII